MTDAASPTSLIGTGIYSVGEAALYVGVPRAQLARYFADPERSGLLRPTHGRIGKDRALSFLDLIEATVTARLRREGVSMQAIRRARENLIAYTNSAHPFAHERLAVWGRSIVHAEQVPPSDQRYIDLERLQVCFPAVIEPYLKTIDYDADSHLAARLRLSPGVVLDPRICFGAPIVQRVAMPTHTLVSAWRANEYKIDNVVRMFPRTSPDDVQAAIEFEDRLPRAA